MRFQCFRRLRFLNERISTYYLVLFKRCVLIFTLSILFACSGEEELVDDVSVENTRNPSNADTVNSELINSQSNNEVLLQSPIDSPKVIGGCELSEQELALWEAHNAARADSRLCGDDYFDAARALDWHCDLAQAAENHAMDMGAQNYFDHTGLDGSTFSNRAQEAGYDNFARAENIAAGQSDVESVMSSWLNSPGHCSNIMSNNQNEMGASGVLATGARFSIYWTSVFGTN